MNPYFAYAKKSFLNRSAYRFDHLMSIVDTCLQIYIFWGIYRALYGTATEVDGITMPMVTTSFVLSIGLGAIFSIDEYYLSSRINNGTIANELLRPVSVRGRMVAENAGNALFNLIFKFTPAAVLAVVTIGIIPPASPVMLALFLLSALFGFGILWTLSVAVQTLAFWLTNIWSVTTIKNVLVNVLSGSMIPLWFMPDWLQGVLKYTPFSSVYFTPVQIYLGELDFAQIFIKCVIQLAWVLLLFLLGDLLWRMGEKKLVVQGG